MTVFRLVSRLYLLLPLFEGIMPISLAIIDIIISSAPPPIDIKRKSLQEDLHWALLTSIKYQ